MTIQKVRSVRSVEDAIVEDGEIIKKMVSEADDDGHKASTTLLQAIHPHWYRWIKESGAKNEDIVRAVITVTAAMLCEVIANVSNTEDHIAMAKAVSAIMEKNIITGSAKIASDTVAGVPVDAFRMTDA